MVLGTEFARHVVLETKISPSESEKGSLQSHFFPSMCMVQIHYPLYNSTRYSRILIGSRL